ncbi:hypothetical protein CY35_04G080400 [Sphagnum magellanicum]|nr:hypothetical protein CY35_04G080400 [Sphagnum magellanicum]
MQVVRLLRSRLHAPLVASFRGSHIAFVRSQYAAVGNNSLLAKVGPSPSFSGQLTTTLFHQNSHLRTLKLLQPAIWQFGVKYHTGSILGLTLATSYLSRWHGLSDTVQCEQNQQARVTACSVKEGKLDEGQEPLVEWLQRLWVPALVLLTVATGYQYPFSLFVTLVFLMWSTKPTPLSIYVWVEKRRLKQAYEKRNLDSLKDKLNPTATVMHVEVRDYMLFCLASVTSLTENSTMVGCLGDWWVIYTSSSTITALGLDKIGNLDKFAKELSQKKEELESESKRVAEDGIAHIRAWWDKHAG